MLGKKFSELNDCISVVLTTFNDEDTITPVLINLLSAGLPPSSLQLIIVDGGSTDNTLQLVQSFIKEHGNSFKESLLITHSKNLGVSKARNDGIRLAKCMYTLILDSDIILPPDTLKNMLLYLASTHQKEPHVIGVKIMLDTAFPIFRKIAYGKIHKRNLGASETLLIATDIIKKNTYNENLGPPHTSDEDIELGARLLRNGYKIHLLGNIIGEHRKSSSTLYIAKSKTLRDIFKKTTRIIKSYFHPCVQKGFYAYYKSLPLIDKIFYMVYFTIVFILVPISLIFLIMFTIYISPLYISLLIAMLITIGLIFEAEVDLEGLFDIRRIHLFLSYCVMVIFNRALRFSSMLLYILKRINMQKY